MIHQGMNNSQAYDSITLSIRTFENLRLPDSRLKERLDRMVAAIARNPQESFPQLFPSCGELEGFYRFVNNKRIDSAAMFSEAYRETAAVAQDELILAIHDTTSFIFPFTKDMEGLGPITSQTHQGFLGHFCLGVSLDREIFGLMGLKTWARERGPKKVRRSFKQIQEDPHCERKRWGNLIWEVQQRAVHPENIIHVADREADEYVGFYEMMNNKIRYVFRVNHDRRIVDSTETDTLLFASLEKATVVCEREIAISERKPKKMPGKGKANPPRKRRNAQLGVSSKTVEIRRGNLMPKDWPATLTLNYVRVFELNPPEGEEPVEWMLVTSEPIATTEDTLKIVDIYCNRWVIEEYFKALKTGCSYEERRVESYSSLLNILAIFAPMACKIYNLKMMGREHPEKPATIAATPTQIKILTQVTQKSAGELSTVGTLMLAIAALGGHIKHNGPPGWQVLIRGYKKLLQLEEGWLMAQQFRPAICDEL